jgi:sterol desaturase/sphingolipid hydroxylase (fatty acid hydroxylase superfamily)
MEEFFKSLLVSVPAALVLDIQPAQVGLLASIVGSLGQIWGQYLHSNIRISLGTPFLTGPQFHRIHHSVETHHQNKNFSTYLPVWDILFGTYYRPSDNEYPRTGVVGEPSNPTMREVFLGPILRWGCRLSKLTGGRIGTRLKKLHHQISH